MNYIEMVKKLHRDVHDALPRQALSRLSKPLDRAGSMKQLLDADDPAIDACAPQQIVALSSAYKAFARWKDAATSLRRELALSKLNLPDGALEFVFTPREISSLGRAARMCPRASFPNHDAWRDAVKAHVDLWNAAVQLGLEQGRVKVSFKQPDHPEAEEFASLVSGGQTPQEMIGYRWLGSRRGERAEILTIELELPASAIAEQARARLSLMGLAAQKRGADSILEELVLADLESAVLALADERSEEQAIDSTRNAYLNLLEADPLRETPVVSTYSHNGKAVGVAILNQDGEIDDQRQLENNADLVEQLRTITEPEEIGAVVLPLTTDHADLWRMVEEGLAGLPIAHCPTFGLSEARQGIHDDKNVAAAAVLGRRMLNPLTEWNNVDPIRLGLGEYPREVDPEALKNAIDEVHSLARWQERRASRAPGSPTAIRGGAPRSATVSRARLNPMVKTISDLKPGMTVTGLITNLTRFGAFVNIGLATEAMIHVSQLSVEFVDDPSKVVKVGQRVEARVIEVIPEKKRIGLSLKPAEEPRRNDDRGQQRNKSPQSKHAALADLDALFKKSN